MIFNYFFSPLLLCTFLTISNAQIVRELPDNINRTACIPLNQLQDSAVQRGLGELRKVRQVHLYLVGSARIDVTVSVATRFLDDDFNLPIVHQCGYYQGLIDNNKLTISCMEAADEGGPEVDPEGYPGYAVYAQFHGDASSQTVAICQMDIALHYKNAEQKKKNIEAMLIFTGVVSAMIILGGIGVVLWYFWNTRRMDTIMEEEEQEELYTTDESEQQLPNEPVTSVVVEVNKSRHQTEELEDDVFLPSPTEDE